MPMGNGGCDPIHHEISTLDRLTDSPVTQEHGLQNLQSISTNLPFPNTAFTLAGYRLQSLHFAITRSPTLNTLDAFLPSFLK
jgi:hypothetical protein